MSKPATRLPTPRDARMREGLAAILTHGSERKASEACGIPRTTLKRWAESTDGKAILAELSEAEGAPRADRIWRLFDLGLTKLEEKIATDDDITAKDLAIVLNILCDKARAMTERKVADTGDVVVTVFGGKFASESDGGATMGVAAQVVVKKGAA